MCIRDRVWQALVRHLHAGQPSRAPDDPVGVIRARAVFDAQHEPPRGELFIAGTEQPVQRRAAATAEGGAGITSPRDGSLYALDPDIPPAAQRITFEGEPGSWVLDGRRLGSAPRWSWAPWPGRHRLDLLGRDGRVIQSVRFEVRGAVVKTAATAATASSR
jgi:penicillin-binding protein 1C